MSDLRGQVGEGLFRGVRELLERAFPSAKGKIGDADVDGVIRGLWRKLDPEALERLGLPRPASAPEDLAAHVTNPNAPDVPYFVAEACHSRPAKGTPDASAPYEEFIGYLPVVRVSLAAGDDAGTIQTKMGDVEPNDHLVFSVAAVNERYAAELGYPAARVDVITPVRLGGTRFGAIAVYLGYQDASAAPSFYLLEAGLATGQPERLYFGQTIDTRIVARSDYQPTPFSSPNNTYVGTIALTMNASDPTQLDTLEVEARHEESGPPYIRLFVKYVQKDQPVLEWPGWITAEAALRVAAIGHAIGQDVPFGPLSPIAAEIANLFLDWVRKPAAS